MSDNCYLVPGRVERQPIIVIPACDRDCQMMLKNLSWMKDLGGVKGFDALVSQDGGMNRILAREVIAAARLVFNEVSVMTYEQPRDTRWPWAANWAFQAAAWYMNDVDGRAWFWCEADCVPLKEGWMDQWAAEYWSCGKPIMGAVVDGRGHCNGTAIYPAEFATLSPAAMTATDVAWDWVMRPETIELTHHSKLMCHVWGIENGKASPYGGHAAVFGTQADVDKWVCPDAVLFHRSKDGTLIDRLRERRRQPQMAMPGGGGMARI